MKWKFACLLQFVIVCVYAQETIRGAEPNRIREERFIHINGIEQWVTIKGDKTKPVVLFIHGGPGSPMSPYADAIYGEWENNFILVQWDQRGTARTYGRNAPEELTPEYLRSNPLTLQQMTADGLELAQYLVKHLGKKKIVLFGSSWGSALAVAMVQQRPELFHAYIGHSQLVHPAASDLSAYHEVLNRAQKSNDHQSLEILQEIGKPPYDAARNAGRLMRIIKAYQQKDAVPAPDSWFVLPPEYDNYKDDRHRSDGDDYSFVNYTGDTKLGVASIAATINFFEDGLTFKVPVFLIQGAQDIQTPLAINRDYFEKIKAPRKEFTYLPKTAHGFNQSVIDAHLNIMNNNIAAFSR